ncbi:MAG UNVERIFIED_CONTAM: DNA-directed RNA polymerase subunit omega [Planctomycetaceae bacterium]|jgi:DNA-directed RNA polymerase subunit omega
MLDDFREDDIVRKVGGRFRLSSLIQKRMVQLNRGAPQLVDIQTKNLMEIVVAEIMQDKIFLDATENVRTAKDESSLVDKYLREQGPSLDDL